MEAPLTATARPQHARRNTPTMRAVWAVAVEKYERMSALPIAKVKVAVRKHSPTRTEVLLTEVVVGVGAPLVGQNVVGV